MRLVWIDLMFSWPPHGGADVDAFHTLCVLQHMGHEVVLVGIRVEGTWERGAFASAHLPFAAERIDCRVRDLAPERLVPRLRQQVDLWAPDVVVAGDSFFLKPYVMLGMGGYPVVARYYAYEMACPRSMLRFDGTVPCTCNYLDTPDRCRRRGLDALGASLRNGLQSAWVQEYLAARAYATAYHDVSTRAHRDAASAMVSNPTMASLLEAHVAEVAIVPGGVDLDRFSDLPSRADSDSAVSTIVMAGRAEDSSKGIDALLDAGRMLAETRDDFRVVATMPQDTATQPWLDAVGWLDHASLRDLYAAAAVCVVPSVWDEPFGLVALEAMACGRPVCASRVGGLVQTVVHGETGFLFERGNVDELAAYLAQLLDDPGLRQAMGRRGRERVERVYTWDHVVATHTVPVLEAAAARR